MCSLSIKKYQHRIGVDQQSFNNWVWFLENSLHVYRKHMSLSELSWLGPITKILFRTASGIVSHFLAFETLYLADVLPIGSGVVVLSIVFSHDVLTFDVINLFDMDGIMVAMVYVAVMVDVSVIFSMKVVSINVMTMVVIAFMMVELKMNTFIM